MRKLIWLLLLTAPAYARVGGGESYSGGGGSSSGGGDGGLVYFIFRMLLELCIYHPMIGIPLVLALVGGYLYYQNQQHVQVQEWSSSVTPYRQSSSPVKGLQEFDPNFSRPLFLDFLGLLYTRAESEKVSGLASLAAYLSPEVRSQLETDAQKRGLTAVDEVIVGAMRLVTITGLKDEYTTLSVALETNYTEHRGADQQLFYSVETWYLKRKSGVLSKGPEEITKFACPSCGNPGEIGPDGKCPFCDRLVTDGSYGWIVASILVTQKLERPPMAVGGSGQEVGTDLPTVFQPDFGMRRKEFATSHPDFAWSAFEQRVTHIFTTLQKAWSAGRWEEVRPFESDSLFQTHRYWLTMLERQGLRNVLEDVVVEQVVGVRIEADAYFDALTVRIYANMKDYTLDRGGQVVQGSKTTPRRFTEYWTFIRRTGYTRGPEHDPARCPSCGAPLDKVNMAGICEYCGSKITSGEFDWVLSRIEQDEAYEA